jgi:hypothetical protein
VIWLEPRPGEGWFRTTRADPLRFKSNRKNGERASTEPVGVRSASFNPLKERGIPIGKQFRNWAELNGKPYDAHNVPAYTRTPIILMNGIEVEAALFSHNVDCPGEASGVGPTRQRVHVQAGLWPGAVKAIKLTFSPSLLQWEGSSLRESW